LQRARCVILRKKDSRMTSSTPVRLRTVVAASIIASLGSHLAAAPAPDAGADSAIKAEIIDLTALTDATIGPVLSGTLRAKTLVSTPQGSVSVQVGNAPKHTHQESVEIQYVVSGSGTFWLGDTPRQVHAGDLIIVPKGVVHGGSVANGPELKMIAIKLPPQVKGDVQVVP
jgi:quercetin dioxygenase-like cupin family protein